MELPLRLQAAQFAAALLFGLLCGVVYDLLRAPRRRIPALTVPADLLYALFLLLGLLALALYVGCVCARAALLPARHRALSAQSERSEAVYHERRT